VDTNAPGVKLPDGTAIFLDITRRPWRWHARGDVDPEVMADAERITDSYEYNVGHGYPGSHLADMVAREVGGELVAPPAPPLKPGVMA
jgi:hypothetical protein